MMRNVQLLILQKIKQCYLLSGVIFEVGLTFIQRQNLSENWSLYRVPV